MVKIRFHLFVVLVILISNNAYSQIQKDSSETKFNFPKYSFQFEVNDIFKFSSFEGSAFSGKYHYSNNSAFRIGVSLSSNKYEFKDTYSFIPQDSIIDRDLSETNDTYLSMSVLYLYYLNPQDEIKAFIGIGPRIGFNLRYKHDKNNYYPYSVRENTYERNSWFLGLNSSFGVEWFFRGNMSLMLAYGIEYIYSFYYMTSKTKYSNDQSQNDKYSTERSGYRLDYKPIRLGLSIYFNS